VEQITSVAVGGAVLDRLEVTLNHDTQTCLPCSQRTSSSNRFLEDSSPLLASEIIIVIEQTSFNNDTTVDDGSVLANLNNASDSINEVLVNEVGIELVENTIFVATTTPTQMPTVAPGNPTSKGSKGKKVTKAKAVKVPVKEKVVVKAKKGLSPLKQFQVVHLLHHRYPTLHLILSLNTHPALLRHPPFHYRHLLRVLKVPVKEKVVVKAKKGLSRPKLSQLVHLRQPHYPMLHLILPLNSHPALLRCLSFHHRHQQMSLRISPSFLFSFVVLGAAKYQTTRKTY
jgi:hypothetical protein